MEGASRSFLGYGPDLNGDGIPELMVAAVGELQIHPGGAGGRGGRDLVEKLPRWRVPSGWVKSDSFDVDFDLDAGGDGGVNVSGSWEPMKGVTILHAGAGNGVILLVEGHEEEKPDSLQVIRLPAR